MRAQTIQIDSTFTADGEIFPFGQNDTIFGLSISGSVSLLSDTSLVRIILTDNDGNEWMVYEAYPFITPAMEFEIIEVSDETRYRSIVNPNSIKITLIQAILDLDSAKLQSGYTENLENLQENHKNYIESDKVDSMNYVILFHQMLWLADRNPVSEMSYNNKVNLFGEKYNLCGLDYYRGGIYDNIPGIDGPVDESELVESFDWRNRHGANDPDKEFFYFDVESEGSGWLTSVKNQNQWVCSGLCYIYGPLAVIEGVANLYLNYHIDYDLSEQHVLDCDEHTFNECMGGGSATTNKFARNYGILDEMCYPRDNTHGNCREESLPVGDPNYRIKIADYQTIYDFNFDTLKVALIKHGPLKVTLDNYPSAGIAHDIALIGYEKLKVGSVIQLNSNPYISITLDSASPYIGQLSWIFKNSWGDNFGENGYCQHLSNQTHILYPVYYKLPIDDLLSVNDSILPRDADQDGYWNWGISEDYDLLFSCSSLKDSDDSESRIGPYDTNYYGIPIMPEIALSVGLLNADTILNGDFYYFQADTVNDCHLNFIISNPGTAQLNLHKYQLTGEGLITIEYENYPGQYELTRPDTNIVCMNDGKLLFKIKLNKGAFPGALAHVHIYLNEHDMDTTFEFTLAFNGCLTEEGFDVIDTTVTWDEPYRTQQRDLHIARNAELTITGTVLLSPEADIIIEPEGHLILDGGTLTRSCKSFWNGIDIWGDTRYPQSLDYQGKLSVMNGGTIEFADTAVATARIDSIYTIPSGGMISCRDAVFKDNFVGVCMFPYISPIGNPNLSRFKRTTFTITDDFYQTEIPERTAPKCGIQIAGVIVIRLEGCSFTNESNADKRKRGCGIINMDASCFVTNTCELDNEIPCQETIPCKFEGLDYGIKSFNIYSARTITIDSAEFIDNYRGIYMSLTHDATIINNRFELTAGYGHFSPGDTLIGIYSEFSNRYRIEENSFTGNEPANYELVGINLLNSGPYNNEIYNNNLVNLSYGIIAAGENRNKYGTEGLCIKCNDFRDCINDIFITPQKDENGNPIITDNTGIALKQGDEGDDNTSAAGNTFSENAQNNYWNDDGCKHIDYTYHGDNPPDNIIPSNYTGEFTPLSDDDAYYSKSGSCPSHLGGGINPSLESYNLSVETSMISAYRDTLQLLVDGGNTEALNYEVISSYPQEALVVRQNLLNASPYLSDTVMISAIEKEEVLCNAMIRDILVANPQAPKSHVVMNALEQRQAPVPEYMVAEIMQGTATYGAKELLEQQLGRHIAARDEAWGKLNLFYRNDTINPSSYDSLVFLLENEDRLAIKYDLAFLYLERQDSSGVFALLENTPSSYYLSDRELMVHGLYAGLFELLWDLKSDSSSLDSTKLTILSGMASHYPVLPAVYAANMLIKTGVWLYEEPVYLPDPLKTKPVRDSAPGEQIRAGRLKVFPNPAGTYVIAEYDLDGLEPPFSITLTNLQGIDLKTIPIKDRLNQIIIPTMEYSPGVYFIRLHAGKGLIDSKKITIIR